MLFIQVMLSTLIYSTLAYIQTQNYDCLIESDTVSENLSALSLL